MSIYIGSVTVSLPTHVGVGRKNGDLRKLTGLHLGSVSGS